MELKENQKVKRGEIYLHDFGNNAGSIQNGIRPVLVVQCNEGNQTSTTTIVAAITSVIKKSHFSSHIILGDKFGLKEPSMLMLEQLKTVNQSELVEYIGFVDSEYLLRKINFGLKKSLGLWVDKAQKPKSDIRCLCSKCLEDYKSNQDYIVRRIDPFAKEKRKCDQCSNMGYDYLIYDKSISKRPANKSQG